MACQTEMAAAEREKLQDRTQTMADAAAIALARASLEALVSD